MIPTCRRRRARSQSRTSTPSTRTRPRCASYERLRSRAIVDLPSPVGPTSATRSPGATLSEQGSEEHTSELQSLTNLVCRLLLEKKKKKKKKIKNNNKQ